MLKFEKKKSVAKRLNVKIVTHNSLSIGLNVSEIVQTFYSHMTALYEMYKRNSKFQYILILFFNVHVDFLNKGKLNGN